MSDKCAGIIIIGDEILKGQVVDTNSSFLTKRLYALGIKVAKISVVPDNLEDITSEVKIFSKQFHFVITTGGIGPTHDDITYESVARAFDESLVLNEKLCKWVTACYGGYGGEDRTSAEFKMARVPESAIIHYSKSVQTTEKLFLDFPIVSVANVYIFPGIPSYLENLFVNFEYLFKKENSCIFYSQCLYLNRDEIDIVQHINLAVATYKESVIFGSYPILGNNAFVTKITLESTSKFRVWEAEEFLISHLPENSVVKKDVLSANDVINSVYKTALLSPNKRLVEKVSLSIKVIEESLTKYTFPEICISFNGGKDCTVLVHLVCAMLWHKHIENKSKKVQAIYIAYEDTFKEVEVFIDDSLKRYNLELKIIKGCIKHALKVLLDENKDIKAVLMGTRRTDPYSEKLRAFQMTDKDWPQVMRVSPLLDWDYEDVWTFLKLLAVPYCCLYDIGYTSIGSRQNTVPNPSLQYIDESGTVKYHPAHLLRDGDSERSGRQ